MDRLRGGEERARILHQIRAPKYKVTGGCPDGMRHLTTAGAMVTGIYFKTCTLSPEAWRMKGKENASDEG